jgi:Kef-type K+ transport system membrane component KefB
MLVFVVLAQRLGLEVILGAFVAGAVLRLVDRDMVERHPQTRVKLDAVGYGFLVRCSSWPAASGSISAR